MCEIIKEDSLSVCVCVCACIRVYHWSHVLVVDLAVSELDGAGRRVNGLGLERDAPGRKVSEERSQHGGPHDHQHGGCSLAQVRRPLAW